jgi:ribosomal protein S26
MILTFINLCVSCALQCAIFRLKSRRVL